jgi:hypothetical protein
MRRGRAIAGALVLIALAAACGDDVPDLVQSRWNALEIEYCTSNGDTKVWLTTDTTELEKLRGLMAPAAPRGLTMILASRTNELRLDLVSGQRWRLYYRTTPTTLTFHDPDSRKRSFVVDVSAALYAHLSSALIASGGQPISLKGDCRIPAMAGR